MGFFDRLKAGLSKTREKFIDKIDELLHSSKKIDDDLIDELEETLITSDVGMATTEKLIAGLRKGVRRAEINSPADVKNFFSNQIREILTEEEGAVVNVAPPRVILMIGVNGAGKTTTIGKLGAYYSAQGKKVMMAAADTFRAGAIDKTFRRLQSVKRGTRCGSLGRRAKNGRATRGHGRPPAKQIQLNGRTQKN